MPIKALVILHTDFEEIEAVAPIDLLRRSGIEVTTASVTGSTEVKSSGSIWIRADDFFEALKDKVFDALIIPGGPGISNIRTNPEIKSFILKHYEQNKCLACICAAPLMLLDLGLNASHAFTCHPSVASKFTQLSQKKVHIEKNIITADGAGSALAFAVAILHYLQGADQAATVSNSICM